MKNMLKIVFFIFGYVASIGFMILSMYGLEDGAGAIRETVQMTVVEGAGIGVMYLIYKYIYLRLIPEANDYVFRLPAKNMILSIFFIFPFICFVKTIFVGWNECSGNIWFLDKNISWNYIGELFLQIPIVAVVGPIFEEICYRMYTLSSARTKVGKIIAIFFTVLLFSIMHGSSWKYVLPDAVLFSVIYIITKNAAVPILLHIANNFSTIIVPMIAGIYSLVFKNAKIGIMGIPLLVVIVILGCFLLGMIGIIGIIRGYLSSNRE